MTSRSPCRRGLAVLALAALALAGCTSSPGPQAGSSDGEGVVGIALPSSDDLAGERLGEALGDEMRSRGYRVDLQYAADAERTQASQVQNMVTKGEDAIVLVPVSQAVLDPARAVTDDAGVSLVVAGRDVDGTGAVEAVDAAALGRAQARALLDAMDRPSLGEPTPVAIVTGVADDPDDAARYAAASEVLDQAVTSGTLRIVAGTDLDGAAVADSAEDVEAAAEERVRALLGSVDEEAPRAVLALGDAVSRGVVAALTTPDPEATASPSPSAEEDPDPVTRAPLAVITTGGDASTVRALRDGVVTATVFLDTRTWAGPLADAVVEALAGDAPTPSVAPTATTVERAAVESVFLESDWLRPEDLEG